MCIHLKDKSQVAYEANFLKLLKWHNIWGETILGHFNIIRENLIAFCTAKLIMAL